MSDETKPEEESEGAMFFVFAPIGLSLIVAIVAFATWVGGAFVCLAFPRGFLCEEFCEAARGASLVCEDKQQSRRVADWYR